MKLDDFRKSGTQWAKLAGRAGRREGEIFRDNIGLIFMPRYAIMYLMALVIIVCA